MKHTWEWLAAFLPALIGTILVIVLVEFNVIEFNFTIHDVDTFLLFSGLLVTIVITSILLSREGIRRMQIFSLEQARQEANAERSRFLRLLDHELKNPLMGIKVALSNLADISDPDENQHIRNEIDSQVTRLSRLVYDLRKIADLGTQQLERLPVDLNELLDEVYTVASDEPGAAERVLTRQLPDALPTIAGDYDLLLVAIYNLLSNAIKYTRPGDRIELRTRVIEAAVQVEVQDTGSGIAADDLPYVWDELFRAETAKSVPGSGIGLALVKLIIERHGGHVQIASEVGQGTTVTVLLPNGLPRPETDSRLAVTGS